MRTTCRLLVLLLLTLPVGGPLAHAHAADAPAGDPFEPTVSRQEADLLQTVMARADTDLTGAIAQLRAADLPAASPALDYALGNLLIQTNRLADAEAAYREALRKLPRFRAALNNLARVHLMQDRPANAIAAFAALVRDGQADADTYVLYGHASLLQAHTLSAETAYRQALLLRPGDVDARRGLAKCFVEQLRLTEALAITDELLSLRPDDAELWSLRANVLLNQDRAADALASLETARRLHATTPDMLATLGDLYVNHALPADAVTAYHLAFAATNAPLTRQLRAVDALLQGGNLAQADILLARIDAQLAAGVAESAPDATRQILRLKADAARLGNRPDVARQLLRDLLRQDPLDGAGLLALGDLERALGQLEEACLAYERAARIQGFEARALVRHAQTEVERTRYARAVELLEAAQTFDAQPHVQRYLEQVRKLVN